MSLCGSNSCIFGAPLGAGVNGPCSCFDALPREDSMHVRRAILGLRNNLKSLTAERDKYHRQAQDLEEECGRLRGHRCVASPRRCQQWRIANTAREQCILDAAHRGPCSYRPDSYRPDT